MHRRALLTGTAALVATGAATPAVARTAQETPGETQPRHRPVARTSAGAVRGTDEDGIAVFRGVPYARPPLGRLRFAPPAPPLPWTGIRETVEFSRPFLSPGARDGTEDALYANVWTPDLTGSSPVLIYVHGGAWLYNTASNPTYDGSGPARRGGLVVVTFNYRLGCFGWGLHEGFGTGDAAANWGLQDQAALLRWVHENARAFGGDSDNITLCGTSAGGSSVWQLALLPRTRPLVRRIVPISAAHVWTPAGALTSRDARSTYESTAHRLDSTVAGLRRLPSLEVMDAWEGHFAGAVDTREVGSGRMFRGPVVDGRWMRGYDHELPTPALPAMVINTRTEGSFYTDATAPAPRTEAELRRMTREYLLVGAREVPDALLDGALDAYRAAARADGLPDDPLSLYTEIHGDGLFRYQILRLAQRRARESGLPQYHMDFAHPVLPPRHGTPHEATSPFLFGTYGIPQNAPVYGDGPLERRISHTFIDLVASFARTGVPRSPNAPRWPVFAARAPHSLVLGGERVAHVAATPKLRQLTFWDRAGWVPRP
ncbi:carboxylesterase family protein [Streptomyces sp. 3N207]|uniref:carboxylesterase family protein n=1 Tax=Streptomyces sp. 3N207 TaxID=3457417 RepID=UPI003FD2A106